MNLEVEIYMNNVQKFFKDNPEELKKLIPESKTEEFFKKVKELAIKNSEKGEEVTLTQKQIINLCVELNSKKPDFPIIEGVVHLTPYGSFSLN